MGGPVAAHGLSFDVEEYFHALNLRPEAPPERWEELPRRAAESTRRLLDLLEEHGVRATFFFLGWVARREPALVRLVHEAGHEVASHGMSHAMAQELGPQRFRAEARESKTLLEDLVGAQVRGFRASTFSVTPATRWAFEILAEEGYEYDSSVFPVRHDRYGWPAFPDRPVVLGGNGGLVELPMLTLSLFGARWPAAGGGYLRLLPSRLVDWALRRAADGGRPGVLYLHPWEFDPGQPRLARGALRRWRHHVGMGGLAAKLRVLLRRHSFVRLDELVRRVRSGEIAAAPAPEPPAP